MRGLPSTSRWNDDHGRFCTRRQDLPTTSGCHQLWQREGIQTGQLNLHNEKHRNVTIENVSALSARASHCWAPSLSSCQVRRTADATMMSLNTGAVAMPSSMRCRSNYKRQMVMLAFTRTSFFSSISAVTGTEAESCSDGVDLPHRRRGDVIESSLMLWRSVAVQY